MISIAKAIKITKEKLESCSKEDKEYFEYMLKALINPPKSAKKKTIKDTYGSLQRSLQFSIQKLEQLKKEI